MNSEKQLTNTILRLVVITTAVLSIPLIAMQYTSEVAWTPADFIFAGTLILGTGLTYKIVTGGAQNIVYRAAVATALATGFILIWATGAVGIIGTESNPVNLLYYGVLLIGLTGSFLSRFQPERMASAMFTTAIAQALVAAIAWIGGFYQSPPSSVMEILSINGFFILLWTGSALMFRYASGKIQKQEHHPNHVSE